MTETTESYKIPVKDLHFDRENPRLAEYGITPNSTDDDIMSILWEAMDVRELVQSIVASGFFAHEPLIIINEKNKNIVIEGNRRLAAVKVLLHKSIAEKNGWPIPRHTAEAKTKLNELPCIKSERKDSWRYLGFKHVNGPAKWSSYAKAKYIGNIHKNYDIQLSDIANQIGDNHRTVQRLYRGLMVIEQAERERVYFRENRYRQSFAFSHLYTGLEYDGISAFISLKSEDEETNTPVPKKKIKELGELCVWLYGSKGEGLPPVIKSQNPDLRRLNAVLENVEAISALRDGIELARAFEISRPPTVVFEEALLSAKRALTTVRAHLTTGYDMSKEHLGIAYTIAEMADDICVEMERKQEREKKIKRKKKV